MNPHRTRFFTFFRLFLIASGMLFAAGVAGAAEYRWTNADGDGYWSTLGNWQVNSGGSWIAAEALPGADDIVRLDNTPGGSDPQTITLTGDVTVSRVLMYGTSFNYTIVSAENESGEYTLTGTGGVPIEGMSASSKDLILKVPVVLTDTVTGAATARPNSTNGGNLIFERPIRYGSLDSAPIIGFWGSTSANAGTLIYRADTVSALRMQFIGSAAAPVYVFIDTPNFNAGVNLQGTAGTSVLYLSASHSFSFNELRLGGTTPFTGTLNVRIQGGEDRDVVFTATNANRGGTVNLLAPLDDSTGTLTLSVNDIQSYEGNIRAPIINLAAGTVLDLRGNQQLVRYTDLSAGIHGEGSLHKTTATVSDIGDHNTYTGGTYIHAGTLRLIGDNVAKNTGVGAPVEAFSGTIGSGDLYIASGATFDLNNYDQTVSALRNDPTSGTGGTVNLGTTGDATLTINGSGDATFDGSIAGAGDLVIAGSGTQRFNGSNSLNGDVSIESGFLEVNGSFGYGSTVSVGAAGHLGDSGTINGDTTMAGILSPGNSPGTISFGGNLIFEGDAGISFDIGTGGSDLIKLIGENQTLANGGPLLWTFFASDTIESGVAYLLIDWSEAIGLDTLDLMLSDLYITNAELEGLFSMEMDGLYVTFSAVPVPEPAAVAFLIGAAAMLVVLRGRRRSRARA